MKIQVEQIIFTEQYKAEFKKTNQIDLDNLADNDVVIKTMVSTISCGTEKANYIGEERVCGDTDFISPFPRNAGYSSAGEVIAIGKNVTSVKIGDRVVVSNFKGLHRTYSLAKDVNLIKIPDGVSYEDASIVYIATFPLASLRKVKLEIGESCLIMGLGILGQLAVKFAKAMGANPIIAVDVNEDRRKLALSNGADYSFDPFDSKTITSIKNVTDGGVTTAIEVTGVGAGLNQTLDCMKRLGRVALLGCTRNSDFTVDYYRKVHCPGITLVGAHTNARPTLDNYPHYFTQNDEVKIILDLIDRKRITLKDLVKETHSPIECAEVYNRLVNDKKFPVCVQFDWRSL